MTNGITALRLILAGAVVVFHAWPVGGFGPDPVLALTNGRLEGGDLAVAGFFGLSGYLLVGSRRRHGRLTFIGHRARRILPAYWLAALVGAALVGPWYLAAAGLPFPWAGGVSWSGWSSHPLAVVNAPLWTLWPEVCCYAVMAALPRRFLSLGLAIAAVLLFALYDTIAVETLRFALAPAIAFIAGALIAIHRDRVPLSAPIALIGGTLAWLTLGTLGGSIVVPVACAYGAIWAGMRLPLRWTVDLSYGTYVLAFPIMQMLVTGGALGLGVFGFALASLAATLPVAAASWFLVERPSLRMGLPRHLVPQRFAPASTMPRIGSNVPLRGNPGGPV